MNAGERESRNRCRFRRGDAAGHYESYFQRANHPERPLAFWIRYTVFSPRGRPEAAIGELWGAYFDGERNRVIATKEEFPVSQCEFSESGLSARIGAARLDGSGLQGKAARGGHACAWHLTYTGDEAPLLLLPRALYERGIPRAKALVGTPNARYDGHLIVDGERVAVDGWIGSQNHNWGSRHTDEYAWGQVAGFEDAPDSFLECATSRLRIGPVPTPWMTMVVLRYAGREYRLNSLRQALRARGRYRPFVWELASRDQNIAVRGRIEAPASRFVALRYYNPPGGEKTCLNTKIARCELQVELPGEPPKTLCAEHRAAFEILTDRSDHGVPIMA